VKVVLTQDIVRELLDYDPLTGDLTWKVRDVKWCVLLGSPSPAFCAYWNSEFAGTRAFTAITNGYKVGRMFDVLYKAHRIIWLWVYGVWPDKIDHINHARGDNRIANLRDVTSAENRRNVSLTPANTSGYVGVKWHKTGKKWQASFQDKGVEVYLGLFSDIHEAAKKVQAARLSAGYHVNHGA
jgi:hypothetical protein